MIRNIQSILKNVQNYTLYLIIYEIDKIITDLHDEEATLSDFIWLGVNKYIKYDFYLYY